MNGCFDLNITSRDVVYKMTIKRKVTRISGYSGTGKTVFFNCIESSKIKYSGVSLSCKYKVANVAHVFTEALYDDINKLREKYNDHDSQEFVNEIRSMLNRYDNMLYVADEDFAYITTSTFSIFCKYTDSFFIFITREDLDNIPYSYREIYNMKESGKFHWLESVYPVYESFQEKGNYLTEDSKAGHQFYSYFYPNVISAGGKNNITKCMKDNMLVIADGAAVGSIMKALLTTANNHINVQIFLPESFEYLLLTSSLIKDTINVENITGLFFSWERYFTKRLYDITENTEYVYTKSSLNVCYYKACCFRRNKCALFTRVSKKDCILGKYYALSEVDEEI